MSFTNTVTDIDTVSVTELQGVGTNPSEAMAVQANADGTFSLTSIVSAGATLTAQASAPSDPSLDDLWYDTDGEGDEGVSQLYIYTNVEGSNNDWVAVTPSVKLPNPPDADADATYVLQYDIDSLEYSWVAASTDLSSSDLSDLQDVDTTTPTDGQVLTYDTSSSTWGPADAGGGGATLTAQAEAPSSPSDDDLWYDTDGEGDEGASQLYIYTTVEGTNKDWVAVTPSAKLPNVPSDITEGTYVLDYNSSAELSWVENTIADDSVTAAKIADDAVQVEHLLTTAAGTDGQVLTRTATGMDWEDASSGGGGGGSSAYVSGTTYDDTSGNATLNMSSAGTWRFRIQNRGSGNRWVACSAGFDNIIGGWYEFAADTRTASSTDRRMGSGEWDSDNNAFRIIRWSNNLTIASDVLQWSEEYSGSGSITNQGSMSGATGTVVNAQLIRNTGWVYGEIVTDGAVTLTVYSAVSGTVASDSLIFSSLNKVA